MWGGMAGKPATQWWDGQKDDVWESTGIVRGAVVEHPSTPSLFPIPQWSLLLVWKDIVCAVGRTMAPKVVLIAGACESVRWLYGSDEIKDIEVGRLSWIFWVSLM